MAKTIVIPKEEWVPFCNGFSRRHLGWLVTIDLREPNGAPRVIGRDLPLVGLSVESDMDGLAIIAGEQAGQVTHIVHDPRRVLLDVEEDGSTRRGVRIEGKDGWLTAVTFRVPMRDEDVNGTL